jgi:hypothetical protein
MRSGFERSIALQLKKNKIKFKYEPFKIPYTTDHTYTPDFELPNGILIEVKGVLDPASRAKMKAVKLQHPEFDIRFVFGRASNKLSRKAKQTYGEWATANGFQWAEGEIPKEWLYE